MNDQILFTVGLIGKNLPDQENIIFSGLTKICENKLLLWVIYLWYIS
jgi:hypothetical protein